MTPQRITLVTLGVADIAASRAFYARLGWQPVPGENADVSFYRMNGMALALFDRSELAADQGRPGAALGTGAVTLAQNFPGTAEVDAAFEAAIEAGATILKRPDAVFWGGYSGYWADPDGHVWELAHNPFWSVDAEGALTIPDPA